MNNKVLVKIISPHFNNSYDVFIPINEYIYVVTELIVKVIRRINESDASLDKTFALMNKSTGVIYSPTTPVRDTDIRNSTELILL